LQGPGKQSAEWQPSSLSLKPDKSPNIVRHICQQQFFSFQSILDPTLLPTVCLKTNQLTSGWWICFIPGTFKTTSSLAGFLRD
jgi:hypothetical protein